MRLVLTVPWSSDGSSTSVGENTEREFDDRLEKKLGRLHCHIQLLDETLQYDEIIKFLREDHKTSMN